jgi:hypothetical protein
VIDAIAGERLNEDTGSEGDAAYERALDDVLEAINAIPDVDEWQPIETARKDGQKMLLAWPDRSVTIGRSVTILSYDDERFRKKPSPMFVGHFKDVPWMRENQPTHWKQMPEAP